MNAMCLKTLAESRSYLSRLFVVAATCCGVAASGQAQDWWSTAGAAGPNFVQATSFDTAVTDLNVVRDPLPGGPATIIYEDDPQVDELLDPAAFGTDCGFSCPPAWRLNASYFLLDRGSTEGLTLSPGLDLGEDGHKEGVRFTLSQHFDCLDAMELTYIGPFELKGSRSRAGAGLNFLLGASGGLTLDSFNNATNQFTSYRSQFNSVELNSKWIGWDVFTQTMGLRYWNLEDDLIFASTSAAGSGLLNVQSDNNALGLQYGVEQLFPLGRWETNVWVKGGLFANLVDVSVLLTDAGTVQFANSDGDLDLTTLVEVGLQVTCRVLPNVSIHGGYEVWWLNGFATGSNQLVSTLTPTTGSRANTEEFFYHGGTAGVEIIW